MKHRRPRQHIRIIRTKRGRKRITINRGVHYKRPRRKVYLSKQPIRDLLAHAEGGHIFIDQFPYAEKTGIKHVSDVLAHEELHNILSKEVGEGASLGLDLISAPTVVSAGKVMNPKTSNQLFPSSKAVPMAVREYEKRLHEIFPPNKVRPLVRELVAENVDKESAYANRRWKEKAEAVHNVIKMEALEKEFESLPETEENEPIRTLLVDKMNAITRKHDTEGHSLIEDIEDELE